MIGLDLYSRQVFFFFFFFLFGPHFDLYQSLNRLPVWGPQNCGVFLPAFVAGWLQGHWWGFISRNYVVWPTFLLVNVFIALKGSHFWFLFQFWKSYTVVDKCEYSQCNSAYTFIFRVSSVYHRISFVRYFEWLPSLVAWAMTDYLL